MPGGRPTIYSDKMASNICEEIAMGTSLRKISAMESMPSVQTMLSWLRDNQDFLSQYERAKEEMHILMSEDIQEIADCKADDYIDGKLNPENVQRARLRIDSRKWLLSKLLPKKYGDKIQTEHSGSVSVYQSLSEEELDRRIKEMEDKSNE